MGLRAFCLVVLAAALPVAGAQAFVPAPLRPAGRGTVDTDGVRFAGIGPAAGPVAVWDTERGLHFSVVSPLDCRPSRPQETATPSWDVGGGYLMFACNLEIGTLDKAQSPPPAIYDLRRRTFVAVTMPPPGALAGPGYSTRYSDVGSHWVAYLALSAHDYASAAFNWRRGTVLHGGPSFGAAWNLDRPGLEQWMCAPFVQDHSGLDGSPLDFDYAPPYGLRYGGDRGQRLLRCGRRRPLLECWCSVVLVPGWVAWADVVWPGIWDVRATRLGSGRRLRWRIRTAALSEAPVALTARRLFVSYPDGRVVSAALPTR